MAISLPQDAPSARICLIQKTHPGDEYGFNLHAEKSKGQYVGSVDANSPADFGGLKQDDRIVGVNGDIVVGLPHKEVVQKIKSNPQQCELFVISAEGFEWYREHKVPLSYELSNIVRPVSERPVANSISQARPTVPLMTPRPILCVLRKQNVSDEFGFNLHAERNKGHFIGAVDRNGIADLAGLKHGQRIVGVNGELIYPSSQHIEVVGLIKRDPLETTLLVASEDVDRWYSDNGIPYSFELAKVQDSVKSQSRTATVTSQKSTVTQLDDAPANAVFVPEELQEEEVLVSNEVSSSSSESDKEIKDLQNVENAASGSPDDLLEQVFISVPPPSAPLDEHHQYEHKSSNGTNGITVTPIFSKPEYKQDLHEKDENVDIFKMSAKEARQRMKHRKRDPRLESGMSLEQKHQLIANL